MKRLTERLIELQENLDHLQKLRRLVHDAEVLKSDRSLRNDVLFSLTISCQLVIDISGDLTAERRVRFENYTEAIRGLVVYPEFPAAVVNELARLPGFRNVVLHEYVILDHHRVIQALNNLDPLQEFVNIVRSIKQRA